MLLQLLDLKKKEQSIKQGLSLDLREIYNRFKKKKQSHIVSNFSHWFLNLKIFGELNEIEILVPQKTTFFHTWPYDY